jgi:hypothetical protein
MELCTKLISLIWSGSSIYDASDAVNEWVDAMEEGRSWLLSMQIKHGVAVSVSLYGAKSHI